MSAVSLYAFLLGEACGFPGTAYWNWRLTQSISMGKKFEGEDLCDPLQVDGCRRGREAAASVLL